MIKLCIFDFDSTLMDGETINFLAKAYGVEGRVTEITHRAMSGELDFFDALRQRVELLKGMNLAVAKEVCKSLPFITGAKDLIDSLKSRGIKVVVFSGGFHLATDAAQERLGFDESYANILHHKDGVLSGLVGGEMMFDFSKGDMIQRLQRLLNISKDQTATVGDGANDISMFKYASLGVAFCAKDALKPYATHIVETKDLRELINLIR